MRNPGKRGGYHLGKLRRFALFHAQNAFERKQYVASFMSREEAMAHGEQLKTGPAMRWQVIDNHTSEVVAEDPGL
jgi:hypothetical protein